MCDRLLDTVAARDQAGLRFVGSVAIMVAIHRRVVALLRWFFSCWVVIAVNGALIAGAAGAGDGQQRCARHRRVNQQQCEQTNPAGNFPGRILLSLRPTSHFWLLDSTTVDV